jgi:hypothetical protein
MQAIAVQPPNSLDWLLAARSFLQTGFREFGGKLVAVSSVLLRRVCSALPFNLFLHPRSGLGRVTFDDPAPV